MSLRSLVGWICALLLLVWRRTCRYGVENDPRPALRRAGKPYAYALLHAHQISALFVNDEERMAAMVSRSGDGDALVPLLTVRRVIAVRGSSRSRSGKDKGGRVALEELSDLARQCVPVLIAVDGPQGPRGRVHRGVVELARQTGAMILPTMVLASRHWTLTRAWDRFQIPKPFCRMRLIFGEPIDPADHEDDDLRAYVEARLAELEAATDPEEARLCALAATRIQSRRRSPRSEVTPPSTT
ncbi:MAG TPA: DUF374 domain-containing protein [Candidatus Eisenbacteria bacterium]|nr:DUF374 domain-containing protein [Candidatus Eisenbacteria bacterium]